MKENLSDQNVRLMSESMSRGAVQQSSNDKHPTPTEQAKIKAWDEAVEYCNKNCKGGDHTYSVAHAAYLAGHASRDKEIEGLKERIKELEGRNKAILNTNGQLGSQC